MSGRPKHSALHLQGGLQSPEQAQHQPEALRDSAAARDGNIWRPTWGSFTERDCTTGVQRPRDHAHHLAVEQHYDGLLQGGVQHFPRTTTPDDQRRRRLRSGLG